jgi:pyridoxamine 5'-phosphate oxidase
MESLSRHTDYGNVPFDESIALPNPLEQFAQWLKQAEDDEVFEPNAMVASTIDPDGAVSSRTVLLKGLDDTGFEFVTNYTSRKGKALLANPSISLLFPWYGLKRQVIVYGEAKPTVKEVSDLYWNRRPKGAQLASAASDQSSPIASRDELDQQLAALEAQFPGDTVVPRPEHWGGFRVIPHAIEFWQGRSMRFHDRIRYELVDGQWQIIRLQP